MVWPRQLQPARRGPIHPDPDLESVGGRVDPKVPDTPAVRLRWWLEIMYIGTFYGIYTLVRNTQGSLRVGKEHAFHNARKVIQAERALHIFHEPAIQKLFLGVHGFVRALNIFYGTGHFVVTLIALIWTYVHLPARYPRMRNTLMFTTGLALFGFAFFPLMPPRLLPRNYRFVDTLAIYGGSWSFNSGTMQRISNQYAAMPSLHFAWATWCVISFWPWAVNGKIWRKVVLVAYPTFTTFTIVVTGNHFFLDAAGGALVLWLGYFGALAFARFSIVDWWRANARAASAFDDADRLTDAPTVSEDRVAPVDEVDLTRVKSR